MSNSGGNIKFEAIREIAAGSLTTNYQTLGGPLTHYAMRIWITNNTNMDIYVSIDGSTNVMKLPSTSGRAYDDKTNDGFRQQGTQFSVKAASVPGGPTGWFGIEVEYV